MPTDEEAIASAVRRARAAGRRLRVVGAGHSWSAVNLPEDEAMSLDAVPARLRVHPGRRAVTVGAGMRLRALSAALAREGLVLPIVGSIQAQSIAGALGTATHGSSLTHGNLSSLVQAMRLVDGTGRLVDVGPGDPRLDGARVHLGALGVVTEVTLPVRPARRLRQRVEHLARDEVAATLPTIARSAEYVKVWWLPHAPVAQVVRYDATDALPDRRPPASTRRWVEEQILHRSAFPAAVALARRRPRIVPPLAGWLAPRYLGAPEQVGRDLLMLNTPMPFRHRETEAALPLDRAPEAVADVLSLFAGGRPAVLFPLEIRFVRADTGWLSPAYGADTCQIGAYAPECADCTPYFRDFWAVMRQHGARPHWGKELDHDAAELRARFPRYADFLALREALDPDRVFGGTFHDRVLG